MGHGTRCRAADSRATAASCILGCRADGWKTRPFLKCVKASAHCFYRRPTRAGAGDMPADPSQVAFFLGGPSASIFLAPLPPCPHPTAPFIHQGGHFLIHTSTREAEVRASLSLSLAEPQHPESQYLWRTPSHSLCAKSLKTNMFIPHEFAYELCVSCFSWA